MKVIILSQQPKTQMLLNLAVSPFGGTSHFAATPAECLQRLQEEKGNYKAALIDATNLCDDMATCLKELSEDYPDIPLVLLQSKENRQLDLDSRNILSLRTPFNGNDISSFLQQRASEFFRLPSSFKISSNLLMGLDNFKEDIYIKTQSGKFLLMLRESDSKFNEKMELIINQERPVYLTKQAYQKLIETYSQHVMNILGNGNDPIEAQISGERFVLEATRALGITPVISTIVHKTKDKILATVHLKDKGLSSIIQELLQKDDKLSAHCLMIGQISGKLLGHTSFDYNKTLEKILFAAILHDMELRDIELKDPKDMSSIEHKLYLLHPSLAADALEENMTIPSDTCRIIREHHELPNGDGFPKEKKWKDLHPLSQHFIIIEKLVELIFKNGYEKESFEKTRNELEDFFECCSSNKTLRAALNLLI